MPPCHVMPTVACACHGPGGASRSYQPRVRLNENPHHFRIIVYFGLDQFQSLKIHGTLRRSRLITSTAVYKETTGSARPSCHAKGEGVVAFPSTTICYQDLSEERRVRRRASGRKPSHPHVILQLEGINVTTVRNYPTPQCRSTGG